MSTVTKYVMEHLLSYDANYDGWNSATHRTMIQHICFDACLQKPQVQENDIQFVSKN